MFNVMLSTCGSRFIVNAKNVACWLVARVSHWINELFALLLIWCFDLHIFLLVQLFACHSSHGIWRRRDACSETESIKIAINDTVFGTRARAAAAGMWKCITSTNTLTLTLTNMFLSFRNQSEGVTERECIKLVFHFRRFPNRSFCRYFIKTSAYFSSEDTNRKPTVYFGTSFPLITFARFFFWKITDR